MKNLKIRTITVAIMLLAMVMAFTACNGSTTTSEEKNSLDSMHVSIEKETEGNIISTVMVWIDESTSISEDEKEILEQKVKEIKSQHPDAKGPYPFGGGATGMSTGDGWTDLTAPLQFSGNNAIIYILTDGWQDAPGGLEGRSFVGPYWGLEVHYVCLERDEHTEELKVSLENSKEYFQGSTVMIHYLDGTSEDVIIKEFAPQKVTVLYEDTDTLYRLSEEAEEKLTKQLWPWWVWLLLALLVLIPLLLLLWWLLRRRNNTASEEPSYDGRIAEPDDVEEPSYDGRIAEPDDVEEPSYDGRITEPDDQGYAIGPSTGYNEDYTYCNCCQQRCCRSNNIAIVAMVAIVAIVAIVAMVIVFW